MCVCVGVDVDLPEKYRSVFVLDQVNQNKMPKELTEASLSLEQMQYNSERTTSTEFTLRPKLAEELPHIR